MSSAETEVWTGKRPQVGTAQAWALEVICADSLSSKLNPGPVPQALEELMPPLKWIAPSRPHPLQVVDRAPKTPRPGALIRPQARARLLHTFAHHELQAAEIFAWAFLRFPEAPEAFRRGLLGIAADEVRHAREYWVEIERLGSFVGEHPVRDWFWERFRAVQTPLQFVSLMGLGFEGGNLDHCALWASRFRAVGDEAGARAQESIGREEELHVQFAVRWFEHFSGPLNFDDWRRALPAPLTPTVMKGQALERDARLRAGQDDRFLKELDAWDGPRPGS
jgi:uncharacterized ferritin-like protein (DUF455 family)